MQRQKEVAQGRGREREQSEEMWGEGGRESTTKGNRIGYWSRPSRVEIDL